MFFFGYFFIKREKQKIKTKIITFALKIVFFPVSFSRSSSSFIAGRRAAENKIKQKKSCIFPYFYTFHWFHSDARKAKAIAMEICEWAVRMCECYCLTIIKSLQLKQIKYLKQRNCLLIFLILNTNLVDDGFLLNNAQALQKKRRKKIENERQWKKKKSKRSNQRNTELNRSSEATHTQLNSSTKICFSSVK